MFNGFMNTFLTLLSIAFSIFIVIGAYIAFKRGYGSTLSDMQDKAISALKVQNEAQQTQIAACDKERVRLKRTLAAVQSTLKLLGFQLDITGDMITIVDDRARRSHTIQARIDEDETEKKEP